MSYNAVSGVDASTQVEPHASARVDASARVEACNPNKALVNPQPKALIPKPESLHTNPNPSTPSAGWRRMKQEVGWRVKHGGWRLVKHGVG